MTLREPQTIFAGSLAWGALFLDRFAPLFILLTVAEALGGGSAAATAALALTTGFAWAASMALARITSGRWSPRRRLLVAMFASVLLSTASLLCGTWGPFVALRGLSSLAAGSAAPAITALAFTAAPAHRRGLDLGIVQSSTRLLGSLVGPTVVTAVLVYAGWRAALSVSAAVVFIAALTVLRLVPAAARPAADAVERSPSYGLKAGGARNIVLCVVIASVLVSWLTIMSQLGVPFLASWLDIGEARAGRLLSMYGLGGWVAALAIPAASDRLGRRVALVLASLVGCLGGLALALPALSGAGGAATVYAAVMMALSGVAMGGLPLVVSIIPSEAVSWGDVGQALVGPVVGAEIVGAAIIPSLALIWAARLGAPAVIALGASLLLLTAASGFFLREQPDTT